MLQEDPREVPRHKSVEWKGKVPRALIRAEQWWGALAVRIRLRGLVSWEYESKPNVKYAQDSISGVSIFLPSPSLPTLPNTIKLRGPSLKWSLKNENFKKLLNATAWLPSFAPWVYTLFTISVSNSSQPPRTEAQSREIVWFMYFKWWLEFKLFSFLSIFCFLKEYSIIGFPLSTFLGHKAGTEQGFIF